MAKLFDLRETLVAYYRINGRVSLVRALLALRNLESHLGSDRELSQINYAVLLDYVRARNAAGASNASLQYEMRILHKGFREMEKAELARTPIFPTIHVDNARKVFFTAREFNVFVKKFPWYLKGLIHALSLTGWRRSELQWLRWDQVDFETEVIRITTSKNEKGKAFPFRFLEPLRKVIFYQLRLKVKFEAKWGRKIEYVFFQGAPKLPARRGGRIRSFSGSWKRALEAAGLANKVPHDLCRTAARRFRRAGLPVKVIKELMGRLTDSILYRYDIVDERDLERGTRQLNRYLQRRKKREEKKSEVN
jgi:integrase